VVTAPADLAGAADQAWALRRHIGGLEEKVCAVRDNSAEQGLPGSQLHALREGLFRGAGAADDRARLLRGRYQQAFARLDEQTGSLFRDVEGGVRETRLLDAMDLAGVAAEDQP
jgi:hypothetical protein